MKSVTSFFNRGVYKKDLLRFAPAWGLYSVILLMAYTLLMLEDTAFYRADNLAGLMTGMPLLNFGYAFINAQLLFGDLYQSRLCNALHALPLRRESWFATHVAAGMSFSILPNLIFALLGMATMGLGNAWSLPLWWVAGSTLQYVCFFGLAVLSILLTGNRFAGTLVYGIVNFFPMVVYWLLSSLYEPLMPGIKLSTVLFARACPLPQLISEGEIVDLVTHLIYDQYGGPIGRTVEGVSLVGIGWLWTGIYATAGIACLVLALVLYRKRALECAGDFMAFRFTEPVLLVIYTLAVGGFFFLFQDLFGAGPMRYLFLILGLVVGWFTGVMLLERNVRIFRLKTVAGCAVFLAVFGVSLGLTAVDPLGLTRWVPAPEQVASVNLSTRYSPDINAMYELELTDPEDIRNLTAVHAGALMEPVDPYAEPGYVGDVRLCLEYTLKNGTVRTRFYEVDALSEAGQLLKPYYSDFEFLTGYAEEEIPELIRQTVHINTATFENSGMTTQEMMAKLDLAGMYQAILADCHAGHMAQAGVYHLTELESGILDWNRSTYLEVGIGGPGGVTEYFSLSIYEDAENTIRWMKENGLCEPDEYWK